MQAWEDLVKTALLGTERDAPPRVKSDAVIDSLLSQFAPEDRERNLLGSSGILTIARRAGHTVSSSPGDLLPVAPSDTQSPFSDAAIHDLSHLIGSELKDLLPEWLAIAATKKRRVPERLLPVLLSVGASHKRIQGNLVAVLGERGRWLAAQNPDWNYALRPSDEEIQEAAAAQGDISVWETGNATVRAAYLAARRRTNPNEAREILEAVWGKEPYEERAAFLTELKSGLSPEDEPFLEAALDDKRKEVRTGAQQLLRMLPTSRLAERMIERVRPLLSIKASGKGEKLEVTLPSTWDKTMGRDGIEQKPPTYPKIGEKAFWLNQIVEGVPLSFWTEHLKHTPTQLIALAEADKDWGSGLIENWTRALMREPINNPWAEPMLRYYLNPKANRLIFNVDWASLLPKEQLESIALEKLDAGFFRDYGSVLGTLLLQCGPVWSISLANRFLSAFQQNIDKKDKYYLSYAAQQYVPLLPEDKMPELYDLWGQVITAGDYYTKQREEQIARSEFRRAMKIHLNEN